MDWTRKTLAAMAVAAVCLTGAGASEVYAQAGASAQDQAAAALRQCRTACNPPFQRCINARIDEDTCRNRWRLCRQACDQPRQTPAPQKK